MQLILTQDVDAPFTADDVHALSVDVEENVVGVSADRRLGNHLAAVDIVDQQQRRRTGADEKPPPGFIEGHREVRTCARHVPGRGDDAPRSVDDGHLPRIGQVDEDAAAVALELERFRMGRQTNLCA